jgi:excisionase family DNA binding protein
MATNREARLDVRTLHEWMQYMEEKRREAVAPKGDRDAHSAGRSGPTGLSGTAPGNSPPRAGTAETQQEVRPKRRSPRAPSRRADEEAALREAAAEVLGAVPPRLSVLRRNAERVLQARQARQQALPLDVEQPAPRRRPRTTAETREDLIQRLLDPQLTLQETARLLNVCPTTVRRYTNRGILRHMRTPGNQRRFRLSDVLEFMEREQRDL